MLTDWELWACANEVLRQHGPQAPVFIADRIGACAVAGDTAGVETWRAIAYKCHHLTMPPGST